MSGKVAARLLIVVLAGIALGGMVTLAARPRGDLPPLPPPPTITVARGDMPPAGVSFEERVRSGTDYIAVGNGFLLQLPNHNVIGVTTAHSLGEGNFAPIVFALAGYTEPVATFADLYAPLGHPRTGDDLTIDYILLKPDAPPDPAIVLQPDPRGAPQPGERVALYTGLSNGRGGQDIRLGTVESVDRNGVWVRLDDFVNVSGMSGSPVISQHTGKVVGMIIAMWLRPGAVSIGANPIGAILTKAAVR